MTFRPLPTHAIALDTMIRIYEKLDRTSIPGCHIWTGATSSSGASLIYRYANIKIARQVYHVARIVYYWQHKLDPSQLEVCHDCSPNPDNPLCMNPLHLWLGEHSENMLDAYDKGNRPTVARRKLSKENILLIRELWKQGTSGITLAAQFDISRALVSMIVNNKKHCS